MQVFDIFFLPTPEKLLAVLHRGGTLKAKLPGGLWWSVGWDTHEGFATAIAQGIQFATHASQDDPFEGAMK